jgi:hypothetical protein
MALRIYLEGFGLMMFFTSRGTRSSKCGFRVSPGSTYPTREAKISSRERDIILAARYYASRHLWKYMFLA